MIRRTTIELDEELVQRAKQALRLDTTRATVEEALRRVADDAENEVEQQKAKLREFFRKLPELVDMDVLKSDEMWR